MNTPEKMWEKAIQPNTEKLQGVFQVKILSGIFVPLGVIYPNWCKHIEDNSGMNMQRNKLKGYFVLYPQLKYTLFDYDWKQNAKCWRILRDYIKQVDEDYFIGQIYIKIWGQFRFAGYFSLTRIIENDLIKEEK